MSQYNINLKFQLILKILQKFKPYSNQLSQKMWYFKQTAKSLWQASKGLVVDTRSKVQKIIDQISQSEQQIISTTKLNQLAALTYDMQTFEQTLQTILKKIKTFQYDIDEARKTHNVLIATNYLLKHGASGFVDQLRNYLNVFQKYQTLKDLKTYEDQVLQKQLSYQLQKIKSRARHIEILLSDKQKLLKEKQLAMLIKQKMKLYQKSRVSDANQSINNDNRVQRLLKQKQRIANQNTNKNSKGYKENKENKDVNGNKNVKDYSDKIDGFLEKYLWKYVDKIDGKFEVISDKVLQNFDKYILGELPQDFQPEGMEQEQEYGQQNSNKKMQKQMPISQYQSLQEDDNDLMKRLEEESAKQVNSNLIDFQQMNEEQNVKKEVTNEQSLI